MLLVTTSLEASLKCNVPILFLGEWCRRYSRRAFWGKLDSRITPYHWDDRNKLCKDYKLLQETYRLILSELATELNLIHKANYSLRYWEILIGPWLGFFIQILYDRWYMIQQAVIEGATETIIINGYDKISPPQDMNEFQDAITSDIWNHNLCAQIIKGWSNLKISNIKYCEDTENKSSRIKNKAGFKKKWQRNFVKLYSKLAGIFSRSNDLFFISTRVNCLCPGGIEQSQSSDFKRRISELIPMGRMAKKDYMHGALVFLCSDASSFMTGEIIAVNGGRTCW